MSKDRSSLGAAKGDAPGRTVWLPIDGEVRRRGAWGLVRAASLFRQTRSGGRLLETSPFCLVHSVPEPYLGRATAGRLAARIQLRSPERGAPWPRSGTRTWALARRGSLGARSHRTRWGAVEAQVRSRVSRPRIRNGDRVGTLDPLRPLHCAPVRLLYRHRRRKRAALRRLEARCRRRPRTSRRHAADSPHPGWPNRGIRVAPQPTRRIKRSTAGCPLMLLASLCDGKAPLPDKRPTATRTAIPGLAP